MEIVIIIFMVIMSIFALSCLTYVTADIVIEQINKKKQPAVAVVAPIVVEKEPEPAPVVVPVVEEMPEIVEHIVNNNDKEKIPEKIVLNAEF